MPHVKEKKSSYHSMNREELYELAKEKGIPGMSHDSKEDLIHALETWQGVPDDRHSELHRKNMDELIEIAKEYEIPGKFDMNKEQLIQAITEEEEDTE